MMQQKTYLPEDAGDGRCGSHLRKKTAFTLSACVPSRALPFVLHSIITKPVEIGWTLACFVVVAKWTAWSFCIFPEAMLRFWPCGFFYFLPLNHRLWRATYSSWNTRHKKLQLTPLMRRKTRGKHKSTLWRLGLRQYKMFVLQRHFCIMHKLN